MLGPALKQLFVNLDDRIKRQEQITKYETAIHRELLGILLTEQFERVILNARPDALVRAAGADSPTDREVLAHSLNTLGIPGGIGDVFGSGPTTNLQVDLSGGDWGDSSSMISCGETICKFKTPVP
jgi:hypothetical protein